MPKSHRQEIERDTPSSTPSSWTPYTAKYDYTPLQWGEPEAGIPELTLGVLRDIIINTARVLVILWLCALPVVCIIGLVREWIGR